MKSIPLSAALLALLFMGAAPEKGAVKTDAELVQGRWAEVNDPLGKHSLTFKEETHIFAITLTCPRDRTFTSEGTFRLSQAKIPNEIDLTETDSRGRRVRRLGIYELKGARLKLCLAKAGRARPTDFKSTPENGWVVLSYKREKS